MLYANNGFMSKYFGSRDRLHFEDSVVKLWDMKTFYEEFVLRKVNKVV